MSELEQGDKKEFTGVFVPADILMAQDLTPLQKLLYAEILALSGNDGCFASSSHFAQHLCITERRIRSNLADLEKLGYITRTVTKTNVRVIQIVKLSDEVGRKRPRGRTETSGEVGHERPRGRTETSAEVGRKRPHKYNNKNNINTSINTKEIVAPTAAENNLEDICKLYLREISNKSCCSPLETDKLSKLISEYGADKVKEAIEIAVMRNRRSLAYIEGILKNTGGDENGSQKEKAAVVRRGKATGRGGLYKQRKVETIEDVERKFAHETSGWD